MVRSRWVQRVRVTGKFLVTPNQIVGLFGTDRRIPISVDNECPGCIYCGGCDEWAGKHLWIELYKNPDGSGRYAECDFCGVKIDRDE